MAVRKNLKNLNRVDYPTPVYFQDNLTAARAKLAFAARKMKLDGDIAETWVWDSKILVKTNAGHIRSISSELDLQQAKRAQAATTNGE